MFPVVVDREPGLGDEFYDAIDNAITRIQEWPRAARVFPGWEDIPTVRTMAVAVFPYRVVSAEAGWGPTAQGQVVQFVDQART